MSATEKLENQVKKYGGKSADEIIEAVRELAAVDVQIKAALDEIETIAAGLPERHNELADKINNLIRKVCESDSSCDESEGCKKGDCDAKGKHEKPESKQAKMRVEVHVVKHPPMMPLALMALVDFLNS